MLLSKSQRGLNFGKEGGDGEPDEEGSEEAHPGAVEGAHVRTLEGEELDFGRLVILVGIDIDVVRGVLLYFSLRMKTIAQSAYRNVLGIRLQEIYHQANRIIIVREYLRCQQEQNSWLEIE